MSVRYRGYNPSALSLSIFLPLSSFRPLAYWDSSLRALPALSNKEFWLGPGKRWQQQKGRGPCSCCARPPLSQWGSSIASMILGALAAMAQTKVKRLLAHSSIGHVELRGLQFLLFILIFAQANGALLIQGESGASRSTVERKIFGPSSFSTGFQTFLQHRFRKGRGTQTFFAQSSITINGWLHYFLWAQASQRDVHFDLDYAIDFAYSPPTTCLAITFRLMHLPVKSSTSKVMCAPIERSTPARSSILRHVLIAGGEEMKDS
nr:NADH-ubiquinone oxidoreductase chain 2 [Tanacetum cinerariifolium]